MVNYHPDACFLTDYAAGSLPKAQALCVATHLHYCVACRQKVRALTQLGSVFFLQQERRKPTSQPGSVLYLDQERRKSRPHEFERLLFRVDELRDAFVQPAPRDAASFQPLPAALPRPLRKLGEEDLEKREWTKLGKTYRFCKLKVNDARETALMHIRAGGSIPHHRHEGDEITVVIQGSFSDQDDKYAVGDFVVKTSGEQHSPVASQDEDCLCISALDKPIVLSSVFYRMFAPLLT